jgi:hypothetical protein
MLLRSGEAIVSMPSPHRLASRRLKPCDRRGALAQRELACYEMPLASRDTHLHNAAYEDSVLGKFRCTQPGK